MYSRLYIILLVLCLGLFTSGEFSPFSENDANTLIEALSEYKLGEDMLKTYQIATIYKIIGKEIQEKPQICKLIQDYDYSTHRIEEIAILVELNSDISCKEEFPFNTKTVIQSGLDSEELVSIYSSAKILYINKAVKQYNLQKALLTLRELAEEDGMFRPRVSSEESDFISTSLGWKSLGFLATSGTSDILNEISSLVPAVFRQAISTKKMLFFPPSKIASSLTSTAQLFSGLKIMADRMNELSSDQLIPEIEISQDQISNICNFFLGHKGATSPEDAFDLLNGLSVCIQNSIYVPLYLFTKGSTSYHIGKSADLTVLLTDALGKYKTDAEITLSRINMKDDEEKSYLSKSLKAQVHNKNEYIVDLSKGFKKMQPGQYDIVFAIQPKPSQPNLSKLFESTIDYKVLTDLKNVEVSFIKNKKSEKVIYPSKYSRTIELNHANHDAITFKIKLELDNVKPQQVFLMLSNDNTEAIFVPQYKDGTYNLDLNPSSAEIIDVIGENGDYLVTILVGDVLLSNPTRWTVATMKITLLEESIKKESASDSNLKPEIFHTFMEPDSRPPYVISMFFSLLTIAPFVILILVFSLGSILLLLLLYFYGISFFTLIKGLIFLGIPCIFLGHRELKRMASTKIKSE